MVDMLGRVNEPIYVAPESNTVADERPIDPLLDGRTEMGQQRALDMTLDEESTIGSWRPINDAPLVGSTRDSAAAKGPTSSSFYLDEILGDGRDEIAKLSKENPYADMLRPEFLDDVSINSDDSSTVVSV